MFTLAKSLLIFIILLNTSTSSSLLNGMYENEINQIKEYISSGYYFRRTSSESSTDISDLCLLRLNYSNRFVCFTNYTEEELLEKKTLILKQSINELNQIKSNNDTDFSSIFINYNSEYTFQIYRLGNQNEYSEYTAIDLIEGCINEIKADSPNSDVYVAQFNTPSTLTTSGYISNYTFHKLDATQITEDCSSKGNKADKLVINYRIDQSVLKQLENFKNFKYYYEKKKYNIYNISEEIYSDPCTSFTDKRNSRDMIISDRLDFIYKNLSLCEEGCTLSNFNFTLNESVCNCIMGFEQTNGFIVSNEVDGKIIEKMKKEKSKLNWEMVKCKGNLSLKGALSNRALWIAFGGVLITIILFSRFKSVGINKALTVVREKLNIGQPVQMNPPRRGETVNIYNSNPSNYINNNNYNNYNDYNYNNNKMLSLGGNHPPNSDCSNFKVPTNCTNNPNFDGRMQIINLPKDPLSSSYGYGNYNFNQQRNQNQNMNNRKKENDKEEKKKQKEKDVGCFGYLISTYLDNHLILSLFNFKSLQLYLMPTQLRVLIVIFRAVGLIAVCCLFFNEDCINRRYLKTGNDFKEFLKVEIIYLMIAYEIVRLFCNIFVGLVFKTINKNFKEGDRKKLTEVQNDISCRGYILFIAFLLLLLVFGYYMAIFYTIYPNIFIQALIWALIAVAVDTIIQIPICLIFGIIGYIGYSKEIK